MLENFVALYTKSDIQDTEKLRQAYESVFNTLRDIPFGYPKYTKPTNTIESVVKQISESGKGTCTTKHLLLGKIYESFGLNVEYLSQKFYWQDQNIMFPPEMNDLLDNLPFQFHTSLLVEDKDNKTLSLVDCTWDKPLAKIGLKVNNPTWPLPKCKSAVTPCDQTLIVHKSIESKLAYIDRVKSTIPNSSDIRMFYQKFDEWLEEIRSS